MKNYILLISVVLVIIFSDSSAMALDKERMSTRKTVYDLNWTKLPNGREISPVFGNMKKGHHITFVKFTPGMKTQPHMHSNDYVGVVITGTARHYQPGKAETEIALPAGSIWSMPANVVHISECISSDPCVFSIHQEGRYDIKKPN